MTSGVSFSPAGENDWVQATMNRPATTGERLWTESRARTEIQIDGALVRMGADTSVSILNVNNRSVQLQLKQGTLNVRVCRLTADQVFQVNTPNLAFTLRQACEYRIMVDPDGNATTIIVRKGWTWIDDAPWGFAVSHYGRWAYCVALWPGSPDPCGAKLMTPRH